MSDFEDGYYTFVRTAGVHYATLHGDDYVRNVEANIEDLSRLINEKLRFNADGSVSKVDPAQLKGLAAEYFISGTHNIDAAVKDVSARTTILESHVVGSIDIQGNWQNSAYGVKYYHDDVQSAKAQAEIYRGKYEAYCKGKANPRSYEDYFQHEYEKYLKECNDKKVIPKHFDEVFPGVSNMNNPLYFHQGRIIPHEQLEEAIKFLEQKILKEQNGSRPDQVRRYQDTLERLTDRIKSDEGSESRPLSRQEAEDLARLAKEGAFDPADWNLTTSELIEWKYIMQQANKAGLSAAVISLVLEVSPVLLQMVSRLIAEGELDAKDFKRLGFAALKGSSLGYIRGGIAAAVTIACETGKLGPSMQHIQPAVTGAVVALTMNVIQNATLMAFGQMTSQEFANRCIQDLIVTSCSLALGSALQALIPALPVFSYLLGSLVGGILGSFVYETVNNCMLAFCVDTGCTFFGLVKQDYTLPKEVMEELGLAIFEYETFQYQTFRYEEFQYIPFRYERFDYAPINIRFLRRGVIGVNTVGYL